MTKIVYGYGDIDIATNGDGSLFYIRANPDIEAKRDFDDIRGRLKGWRYELTDDDSIIEFRAIERKIGGSDKEE